jgi:hypothetical protein
MFFGNESKYRRSKTSLKLCEHVAYFDTVSLPPQIGKTGPYSSFRAAV